jgi:apolipoprotein N-acyltransferase
LPCAFVLHLAFPRAGLPWLAPLALAGLFAAWMTLTPRAAACVGYAAGIVYFALDFSWFGESVGALLGPFGFLLDLGPAVVEALAFALAGAITALAAKRLDGIWIAVVGAAGFTLAELLRSSGLLGVPLYQIGAAFVETPLAPLAAFGGVYTLTFVVALVGGVLGVAAVDRTRRAVAGAGLVIFALVLLCASAWSAWPARRLGPATLRVAAVQGNIRQSVKWEPGALPQAVDRYTELTAGLQSFKPAFVLWPETVIATDLLIAPAQAAAPQNAFIGSLDRLAR